MTLWTLLWGCGPDDDVGIDTPDEVDEDGDGFSPDLGDCDDSDASVYPGAPELWCNGKVENCEGADGNFTVPTDVATIAEGLSAAGAGFTVCVAPGIYAEPDLALTRFGVQLIGLPGGVATLDAGGLGRGLDLVADGVRVENLTIINGLGTTEFVDLPGVIAGGGIRVTGDDVVLVNVTVRDSVAPNGAGVGALEAKNLRIEGGTLANNVADFGGGLFLTFGDATLVGVTVGENLATVDGGGIYATEASFAFEALTVNANESTGHAGGVYLDATGASTLTGGVFSNNVALGDGGGLFLAGGDLTVDGTTFDGNRATLGGALQAVGPDALTLTAGVWTGNNGNFGGALHIAAGTALSGGGNTLTGNVAAEGGGGMYIDGGQVSLVDDVFSENAATLGGGVFCASGKFGEENVSIGTNTPDQVGCAPSCSGCVAR